jgi:hypothetical protein
MQVFILCIDFVSCQKRLRNGGTVIQTSRNCVEWRACVGKGKAYRYLDKRVYLDKRFYLDKKNAGEKTCRRK